MIKDNKIVEHNTCSTVFVTYELNKHLKLNKMEIISTTKLKARKKYKCDWCGLKIKKGEKHQSQALKDNGEIYNWRNHIRCAEIAKKLEMFDYCDGEGLTKDAFQNTISDEYAEIKNVEFEDLPAFKIQLDVVCEEYL
ncbi:MAG: hypothetical protein GY870_21650 [archaeon]|nr:hypothetical protein [archaeon]